MTKAQTTKSAMDQLAGFYIDFLKSAAPDFMDTAKYCRNQTGGDEDLARIAYEQFVDDFLIDRGFERGGNEFKLGQGLLLPMFDLSAKWHEAA